MESTNHGEGPVAASKRRYKPLNYVLPPLETLVVTIEVSVMEKLNGINSNSGLIHRSRWRYQLQGARETTTGLEVPCSYI